MPIGWLTDFLRRFRIDLDRLRAAILESLRNVEPDLELEDWSVPSLRASSSLSEDDGPRCPDCGGRLIFQYFHRIRPPPLTPQYQDHRAIPSVASLT
jgi:hypothetical protein